MTEWFDPQTGNTIGATLGAALGVIGGGIGGPVIGWCSTRGRARGRVFGFLYGLLGLGVGLVLVALTALALGQPYHVWYALGLPGVIVMVVIPAIIPDIRRRYRAAEQRALAAGAIRASGGS